MPGSWPTASAVSPRCWVAMILIRPSSPTQARRSAASSPSYMRPRERFASGHGRTAGAWRAVARGAIVLGLLLAGTACMSKTSAPPKRGPTCATPADFGGAGPKQQLAQAKSASVAYVRAIAAHHYDTAEAAILPCEPGQRKSLTKLWKFMAGMPPGNARIKATVERGKPWPGTATADITLYVRFGGHNTTVWVRAARRRLLLHRRGTHWTITADLTRKNGGDLAAYGFASYERPTFLNGRRATVVY